MAAKKYPKQDGSQGIKWVKLGSVVQGNDGKMFGDLDSLPVGSWFDGNIQLFEAEQQGQSNNNTSSINYHQNNQGNQQQNYNPNNYGNYKG